MDTTGPEPFKADVDAEIGTPRPSSETQESYSEFESNTTMYVETAPSAPLWLFPLTRM